MFLQLLSQELEIALGCTEPIAVAYAAALAKKYVQGSEVIAVTVYASGNVIKNAMSVIIPGTQYCGVDMAAALGVVAGDADKNLEVLATLTPAAVQQAANLVSHGFVNVHVAESDKKLYIEVNVQTGQSCAKVVIADEHTRVELIEVDGVIQKKAEKAASQMGTAEDRIAFMDLDTIWEFAQTVDLEALGLVRQSMELNQAIAEEGLRNPYGLQVGRTLKQYVDQGLLGDDLVNCAVALTAAGTDARMAGCPLPVVSNSGSGNQGISATVPVLAVGKRLAAAEDKILRAVTLSHLISIYIKAKFGRLSALCGAVVSGTGASCGITFLLGGGIAEVKMAIQNMLGNVTGMLCDGAKPGCALKVATCTSAAMQSALLAARGLCIKSTDGIIEISAISSIDNLCRIGNQGTIETDRIILEIMLNKQDKGGAF
ncbi:MAG: L-serine ammonia-lyase, iron-sulfur-dependent, subunit alpha [Negativicutes bacterium]|nr:L-serine ammonia-lyase, iron-sulfur-dependent, subunit alpha [Negativicutes bacterium]